ncbi:ABC-2 family transporter protein [Clostridiaceae bacterium M8S5]|nr:ABC-2 family transporter protein [Clostridiaceae bacterium M8S5]
MNIINLYKVIVKNSIKREFQYRFNLFMNFAMLIFGYGIELLFYFAVYSNVDDINGWTFPQMICLSAIVLIIDALFFGLFFFNLLYIPFLVRRYELDSALLKPMSSLMYISTKSINFGYLIGIIPGIGLLNIGMKMLGVKLSILMILKLILFVINAIALLYSILTLFLSTSLFFVKVDGMISMFWSVVNFGKSPAAIYPKIMRGFMIFGIPTFVIYNIPTQIVFGNSEISMWYIAFSLIWLYIANYVWKKSLKMYYS